jgi:V8-like Glu-specific endopeptidase
MKTEFHRWIGALVSKDGFERPSKGSAVLLSKNIILTAAHNLYDKEYEGTNSKHTNFRFYPGPCGVVESYHPIEDNTWRYPP